MCRELLVVITSRMPAGGCLLKCLLEDVGLHQDDLVWDFFLGRRLDDAGARHCWAGGYLLCSASVSLCVLCTGLSVNTRWSLLAF